MTRLILALRRCRPFALSIFATYVLSGATGMAMVHLENGFALGVRDRIVHRAVTSSSISIAHQSDNQAKAIALDVAGNLFLAAVPQTIGGVGVILPYFSVGYQGWISGIVSVDSTHRSRLASPKSAAYYLGVLLLQFIPFSLCIGAGVRCGVELYGSNTATSWRFWEYRISRETLADVAWIFLLAIPLFAIASAVEFLSPWN